MGPHKYYYNPDTCQYEPVKLRWTSIFTNSALLIITSAALFVVFLLAYGRLFPSERQSFLERENIALAHNYASIEEELGTSASLLSKVGGEEQNLYSKLFGEREQKESIDQNTSDVYVTSSIRKLKKSLAVVEDKFKQLKAKSINANIYYGNSITISDKDLKLMMALPSLMPVEYSKVTNVSGFGQRINPFHKGIYFHPGADFACARGTEVVAAGSGRVVNISRSSIQAGYGNYIEIDHGNGIQTLYAHLEEINVNLGQRINKGDKIGIVGISGGSVAPHLHFEVVRDGEQVDPVPYLMQNLTSTSYAELMASSKKKNQSLD